MTVSMFIALAVLASLSLTSTAISYEMVWGENVGIVRAYVDKIDSEKGLTVRATPSAESPIMSYLEAGTKIQCRNEFRNGWVKTMAPSTPGWVNLKFLKPAAFEGLATKVDSSDLCLGIRAGPSVSHEKVGCAQIGEVLKFTGIMTADNWIQLADRRGWVSGSSVQAAADEPVPVLAGQDMSSDTAGVPMPKLPVARSLSEVSVREAPTPVAPETRAVKPIPAIGLADKPVASQATTAPGVAKGPAAMCSGGWCVDYENSRVSHNGRVVASIECFKDTVCAGIVGQHHVAKAILDGSMTFGKFKLAANGAISNVATGKEVVDCSETGGVDHKCVANFLRKIVGVVAELENRPVSEKAEVPKEQLKKAPGQKTEAKKSRSTKSSSRAKMDTDITRTESSTFATENQKEEQQEREQQMKDDAWESARQLGF